MPPDAEADAFAAAPSDPAFPTSEPDAGHAAPIPGASPQSGPDAKTSTAGATADDGPVRQQKFAVFNKMMDDAIAEVTARTGSGERLSDATIDEICNAHIERNLPAWPAEPTTENANTALSTDVGRQDLHARTDPNTLTAMAAVSQDQLGGDPQPSSITDLDRAGSLPTNSLADAVATSQQDETDQSSRGPVGEDHERDNPAASVPDAPDLGGRSSLLIKDRDHPEQQPELILAKSPTAKAVKHGLERFERFNENIKEPLEHVVEVAELMDSAAQFIGGDFNNERLVKPNDVHISPNGRWSAPVHDEDGKEIGFVYVDDNGWEYQHARQDTSTPGRRFQDPFNWNTLEGIRFRENGAAIDRSSAGGAGGKFAEFATDAVTFGLAGLTTKMVLSMSPETYANANEVASELRLLQLFRRGVRE